MRFQVVVAHTGKNLNNRIFTHEVINDCYEQALKRDIIVYEYSPEGNTLDNCIGLFRNPAITYQTTYKTRNHPYKDDLTYCLLGQIDILDDSSKIYRVINRLTTKPIVFIVQGFGNLSSSSEADGSMIVSNYTLESIQLVNKEDSAFEHCLFYGDWESAIPMRISPVRENKG